MRVLMVLLLAFTALAGCADSASEPEPEDDFQDLELEATDDTGIIRGVVVDPTITPIPGATITIVGQDLSTTSNDEGAFGFSGLAPGFYNLQAARLGYGTQTTQANVEAGVAEPPAVRLMLEPDPSSLPTAVPLVWDGYIACGLSVFAACSLVASQVGDEFITTLPVDRPNVTYLQSEMVWETTTGASPNLQLWQEAYDRTAGARACTFEAQNAPSPNVINTTHGDYNSKGHKECFDSYGAQHDLRLRVFSGSIDGTFPPTPDGCYPNIPNVGSLCTGVGYAIEQGFTVYNHLFYGFKPFDGWQFSVDGDPEIPTQ